MRANDVTATNIATLKFIAGFSARHLYPPSLLEMAQEFGLLSLMSARKRVKRLVTLGYVKHEKNMQRDYYLTEAGEQFLSRVS